MKDTTSLVYAVTFHLFSQTDTDHVVVSCIQTISPTSMVTGRVAEYYIRNIREAKNLLVFGKKLYFPSTSIVTSSDERCLVHDYFIVFVAEASHWDNIPRGSNTWVDYIYYFAKV